jgi:hypothetical protein
MGRDSRGLHDFFSPAPIFDCYGAVLTKNQKMKEFKLIIKRMVRVFLSSLREELKDCHVPVLRSVALPPRSG